MSSVLNMAEMTADNQMDDDARADARELIMAVADLLHIPTHRFEIEECEQDHSIVVRIHKDIDSKPKLTLVSNNNLNDNDNNN